MQYIDKRQFDFYVDGGVRVENLSTQGQSEWPVIQAGTIVTMRVISRTCFAMWKPHNADFTVPRICPFCKLKKPPEEVMVVEHEWFVCRTLTIKPFIFFVEIVQGVVPNSRSFRPLQFLEQSAGSGFLKNEVVFATRIYMR